MRRALAIVLTLLVAGCALGGRSGVPATTYVLTAAATASTSAAAAERASATAAILRVTTPSAAPAYASAGMAYIERPYRIDYFAQNAWADAPARMLKNVLMQDLAASGLFAFVHADSNGIDDTLRLDSYLAELVQTFSPTSSEVRLTIRFDLVDLARRTVLFSETLSATEPAATRDPYAGVVAANVALRRVLDELHARLRSAIATNNAVTMEDDRAWN